MDPRTPSVSTFLYHIQNRPGVCSEVFCKSKKLHSLENDRQMLSRQHDGHKLHPSVMGITSGIPIHTGTQYTAGDEQARAILLEARQLQHNVSNPHVRNNGSYNSTIPGFTRRLPVTRLCGVHIRGCAPLTICINQRPDLWTIQSVKPWGVRIIAHHHSNYIGDVKRNFKRSSDPCNPTWRLRRPSSTS